MPEARARDPRIASGKDYGNPDPQWLKIDWRRHLRRMKLPGAEVNYVEVGEGEPVLFLHGISGCWQNWLETLPHVGHYRRAIALDLPGFGASPMPTWEPDIPAYGRLVHDFCEKLGIESGAAIVGNSMGGFVAAEAVTATPGRFDRLALVSAAGILNTWDPEQRAAITAFAWGLFGPILASRSREILARRFARRAVAGWVVRYPQRLRIELLWEQMNGGLPCPAFGPALRSLIHHDIRDRLSGIEIPTQIVWGFDDRIVPVGAALSFHRRIPGSRLEIFERTRHVPQLERPARFNALLEEFLGASASR